MPDIEKAINTKKERLWLTYDAKFKKLLLDPEKDPALVEIRNMISSIENVSKKEQQTELAKLCFCYVRNNTKFAREPKKRASFETVLGILGIVDYNLAKHAEELINDDPEVEPYVNAEDEHDPYKLNQVDVDKILNGGLVDRKAFDPDTTEVNTPITSPAKEDVRIKNLLKIEKKLLSEQNDPIWHKNSKSFKQMANAIKRVKDYAAAINSDCGKEEILEKLLKDVEVTTKKYVEEKGIQPIQALGDRRLNLALAALLSVNKKEGLEQINKIAVARKVRHDRIEKVLNFIGVESDAPIGVDAFLNESFVNYEAGTSSYRTKEELLDSLNGRIDKIANKIVYPEDESSAGPLIVRYVVNRLLKDKVSDMSEGEARKFTSSRKFLAETYAEIAKSDILQESIKEVAHANIMDRTLITVKDNNELDRIYGIFLDKTKTAQQENEKKAQEPKPKNVNKVNINEIEALPNQGAI